MSEINKWFDDVITEMNIFCIIACNASMQLNRTFKQKGSNTNNIVQIQEKVGHDAIDTEKTSK